MLTFCIPMLNFFLSVGRDARRVFVSHWCVVRPSKVYSDNTVQYKSSESRYFPRRLVQLLRVGLVSKRSLTSLRVQSCEGE